MTVGHQPGSSKYLAANGKLAEIQTSVGEIMNDDFGGVALDLNKWTVWQGGYPGIGTGTQAAMTYSVANSALTVNMQTTSGDDLWFLSVKSFVGAEDLMCIISKSQALVANSIFIGLVEVDGEGQPILNPNLAGDFTNRGGVEFGGSVTTTAYHCEAVGDSSPVVASGGVGVASAWTIAQECYIEFHAEDVIASTALVDNLAGKVATGSRVSTQCPNDNRCYKMLMRFRNTAGPATNTVVTVNRILLVDGFENRVEITSGRGDNNAQKAIATNIINAPTLVTNNTPAATVGANTTHHAISAASTNSTLVKATALTINSLVVSNSGAAAAYFKLYSKNTAPTIGTDTPVLTLLVPIGGTVVYDCGPCGWRLAAGTGYGLTTGMAIADTGAVTLSQMSVHMVYT